MASNFQDLIDARLYHQQPPPPPTTSFASLEQRHLVRRQVKRVEDLDRRSLSLYNDLEEIKRKLVQLANQSNPQRLESELRRAATNILGPIMGSMHDETRLALENIRSVSNGATSRAEMAYAMAAAAKAELNAFQVQQSVPNINAILQQANHTTTTTTTTTNNNNSNSTVSGTTNQQHRRANLQDPNLLQEVMWERIDNHLACHELRLRKRNTQFIKAAMKRATLEIELEQRQTQQQKHNAHNPHNPHNPPSGVHGRRDRGSDPNNIANNNANNNNNANLHASNITTSMATGTTTDYIRLKRTIDDEILNLAKYKMDLMNETKRDMQVWKTAMTEEMKMASGNNNNNNPGSDLQKNGTNSITPQSKIAPEHLGPILRSIQEQLDTFRNDFILHKLQASSRVSQLEEEVQVLRQAMHRMQKGLKKGLANNSTSVDPTTNTNATVPASPATPGLSLRGTIQIGNGRALHDWSTNDVDRWLLQWGANDAVRRRFAEIEIDGELLTLLERNDMEGEMGLLELTSARMVERLLEEINILKRTHGIQTIDVDVEGDNDSSPEQLSPKSLALRNKIAKANQNSMDQIKKQLGELYGKQ